MNNTQDYILVQTRIFLIVDVDIGECGNNYSTMSTAKLELEVQYYFHQAASAITHYPLHANTTNTPNHIPKIPFGDNHAQDY